MTGGRAVSGMAERERDSKSRPKVTSFMLSRRCRRHLPKPLFITLSCEISFPFLKFVFEAVQTCKSTSV